LRVFFQISSPSTGEEEGEGESQIYIRSFAWIEPPITLCYHRTMEINILFDEGFEHTLNEGWLRQVASQALTAEKQTDAEMGILITGQDKMRQLHKEYMDEDEPTDVLSFAMREKGPLDAPDFIFPAEDAAHLGEVIISYPQAEIQAGEHGHSAKKEVAILLIHGVLHLVGYDHDQPERQKKMQAREKAILKLVSEGLD